MFKKLIERARRIKAQHTAAQPASSQPTQATRSRVTPHRTALSADSERDREDEIERSNHFSRPPVTHSGYRE